MRRAWHDLYWHGEVLARQIRRYETLQDTAYEEGDKHYIEVWGEALRKVTVNTKDIAKDVLQVEAIVKGKKVYV